MWQQQQQQQQQRALLQDLSGGVRPRGKAEGSAGASTGGRVHIQEDHGGASAWEGQGGPQPTCRPSWRMPPAALLQVGGQCIYYTAKKGERGGKGGGGPSPSGVGGEGSSGPAAGGPSSSGIPEGTHLPPSSLSTGPRAGLPPHEPLTQPPTHPSQQAEVGVLNFGMDRTMQQLLEKTICAQVRGRLGAVATITLLPHRPSSHCCLIALHHMVDSSPHMICHCRQ